MKVFLSQPFNGKTDEEVFQTRRDAVAYLMFKYGKDIEIVDNFHHDDAPEDAGRLWHLGTSIKMMDKIDGVYFCSGWQKARGCLIERHICELYGIKILE